MENQVYRIEMSDNYKLELYVCNTNEINPHRDIKEIGVVVLKDGEQIDGDIDEMGLDSLIKFLTECKEHISNFNANSKPKEGSRNTPKDYQLKTKPFSNGFTSQNRRAGKPRI